RPTRLARSRAKQPCIGSFVLQGSQVIANFLGRIAGLVRCQPLFSNGDIFVGESVGHVTEVPASRVSDLDTFGGFGDELGLLVIYDDVLHGSVSLECLPRCDAFDRRWASHGIYRGAGSLDLQSRKPPRAVQPTEQCREIELR